MHARLNVSRAGWSITAVLAVIYVLVVLACMLLVGLGTSGSLESVLSSIEWSTIVGFEIGLLGIGIVSFVIAGLLVGAGYLIKHWISRRVQTPQQPGQSVEQPGRSWAIKFYVVCLILPALVLIVLRLLTPVVSSGVNYNVPGVKAKSHDAGVQVVNMGPVINTALREAEPTFTADGRMMYFNCHNADICVSHLVGTWEKGSWTPPEVVGAPVSTAYEEVEPLINAAGDKLYFTSNRPADRVTTIPFLSPFLNVFQVANTIAIDRFHVSILNGLGMGHLWVSYLINGIWSEPRNLNDVPGEPPINSAFHDHCLSFSTDGNVAFWTSNRPGGFGANDIWTSRRVNSQWTAPENLGPNVNSA